MTIDRIAIKELVEKGSSDADLLTEINRLHCIAHDGAGGGRADRRRPRRALAGVARRRRPVAPALWLLWSESTAR